MFGSKNVCLTWLSWQWQRRRRKQARKPGWSVRSWSVVGKSVIFYLAFSILPRNDEIKKDNMLKNTFWKLIRPAGEKDGKKKKA